MYRFRPTNKSERAKADQIEPWRSLQANDKGHRIDNGGGADTLRLNNIVEHGASNISFRPKSDKLYVTICIYPPLSIETKYS